MFVMFVWDTAGSLSPRRVMTTQEEDEEEQREKKIGKQWQFMVG